MSPRLPGTCTWAVVACARLPVPLGTQLLWRFSAGHRTVLSTGHRPHVQPCFRKGFKVTLQIALAYQTLCAHIALTNVHFLAMGPTLVT